MASSKRKQDEKHLKILRELASRQHNKQCFDCKQRGPTYVNMTAGSFVCTACSGILRGLNPPHRVKSISMTSFTPEEIEMLRCKGNEFCRHVWLGMFDSRMQVEPESKDEQKVRDFMINKYEKKRWYVEPTPALMTQFREKGQQATNNSSSSSQAKPLKTLLGEQTPNLVVNSAKPAPPPIVQPPPSTVPTGGGAGAAAATVAQKQGAGQQAAVATGAQASKSAVDLLGDLGGDIFTASSNPQQQAQVAQPAAATSATSNQAGGFANFDNFNAAADASGTSQSSFNGLGKSAPTSAATILQYSGLEGLFDATGSNMSVNWNGSSNTGVGRPSGPDASSHASSLASSGSWQQNTATSAPASNMAIFGAPSSGAAHNPFSMATAAAAAVPAATTTVANPFQAAPGPAAANVFTGAPAPPATGLFGSTPPTQQTFGGQAVGQQPSNTGFANFGAVPGFGGAAAAAPMSTVANGLGAQQGSAAGWPATGQQVAAVGVAASGWPHASQPSAMFGVRMGNAFPASAGSSTTASFGSAAKAQQQAFGGWGGQHPATAAAAPGAAANPFMGATVAAGNVGGGMPPPSNSSNPFL